MDTPTTTKAVPVAILEAMRRIVNYDWATEAADYERQDEDGREHHTFRDLTAVNEWLDDHSVKLCPYCHKRPKAADRTTCGDTACKAERDAEVKVLVENA